jgi:DNA-binding GntR family transcriptional regulator
MSAEGGNVGTNAIRRLQLSEEAAAFIRESIMSGHMRSGEYVRIYRVAKELGLSATPVREALHLLRAEGFVDLDPNKGFRVASVSGDDVSDIFQVFAFVAGELCARATSRLEDEDIVELEALQASLLEASRDRDWGEVEELNNRFHRVLNAKAGSPKLFNLMRLMSHYIPRRFYASIPGWPEASMEDHEAIMDALKRRDRSAARKAMATHITHAGALLAANLEARVEPVEIVS